MASELPTRRRLWNFVILAVAMLAVGVASLTASVAYARMTAQSLQAQLLASCDFAADVGAAPITVAPSGKASELGVKIVADSRSQWRRLGCPGTLAPPEPSFARWAAYYHLPAS